MAPPVRKSGTEIEGLGEKQFYLDEFRSKTLLFSIPANSLIKTSDREALATIVRQLLLNDTRAIVLIPVGSLREGRTLVRRVQKSLAPTIFANDLLPLFKNKQARRDAFTYVSLREEGDGPATTEFLTQVWSTLRGGPLFVGAISSEEGGRSHVLAQRVGTSLRVHKLVLIEADGGLSGPSGKPISFMDENLLGTLLNAGEAEWAGLASRRATLGAVRAALLGGVASVNLCTLAGASRELFTYEGTGTLFTLADYCQVQRLGIDDFEEVEKLIERGQREGLLKPRSASEIAAILVHGYGATIGAHHLAGICALITEPYARAKAGEIVGLYTITRFKGEGVGAKLVARAVGDARNLELKYVFACTTEVKAQAFFKRQGFVRVGIDDVPSAKWRSYDPQRRESVAVFRMDLD